MVNVPALGTQNEIRDKIIGIDAKTIFNGAEGSSHVVKIEALGWKLSLEHCYDCRTSGGERVLHLSMSSTSVSGIHKNMNIRIPENRMLVKCRWKILTSFIAIRCGLVR